MLAPCRMARLRANCSVSLRTVAFRQRAIARPEAYICRLYSSESSSPPSSKPAPSSVTINSKTYATDSWFNIPPNVVSATERHLHLQPDHPVCITRQIIERLFPFPQFSRHNTHLPVVSTYQNFDSLDFPIDHPGRQKSDTYYVNATTLLRTHTSAHQLEAFASLDGNGTEAEGKQGQGQDSARGYLISADVYRRDEIDRSHYPAFHQMEGALTWPRAHSKAADHLWADVHQLEKTEMRKRVQVYDPDPPFHQERNPLQAEHSAAEVEAVGAHLKRSLERMAVEIISRARDARVNLARSEGETAARGDGKEEPLSVRWVEAYFPFTSPSWELEVFYDGDWLEVLGCGVVKQSILADAGIPDRVGWAFGIGLERIAMLLFGIPDIRLFWSTDERFLSQFEGLSKDVEEGRFDRLKPFVPFSKYPECYKDVSFWLPETKPPEAGVESEGKSQFHQNDMMETVREVAGDDVEDVRLVDEFTHPKTGKKSLCYRVNYRSLEKTLTNKETNEMHDQVRGLLVERYGVSLR